MNWRTKLREILGRAGVTGVRLREAAEDDQDMLALRDLVQGALTKLFELGGDEDPWAFVRALYADHVVVDRGGRQLRYPYTLDGTDVSFGPPEEVAIAYVPVDKPADATPAPVPATVIEAVGGGDADRYRVCVIKAGRSKNGNYYPDTVLREAAAMFDGCHVFVKGDREHLAHGGKDFRNLIGALSDPVFVEGSGADSGQIQAVMSLIVGAADPTAVRLREAVAQGLNHLFGLSIDAQAKARSSRGVRVATEFTHINSVDLIVSPGAGGGVISFVEAEDDPKEKLIMDRDELIALIKDKAPSLLDGKDLAALTDDELKALLEEALKLAETPSDTAITEAVESRLRLRELVGNSKLPAKSKERLLAEFSRGGRFTEAAVVSRIKEEGDYLSSLGLGGGRVMGLGTFSITESQGEKHEQMLDAFFDRTHKDHKHARSFKECYVAITGDRLVTGKVRNAVRFTEALDSTSFGEVLGDSITRRMIAEYNSATDLDIWKLLTGDPVQVNDFRTQERTRFGGYGDLPIVAEKGDYTALTSPRDEKAEYGVRKRGGTETITLEMIKNDDVGAIARLPNRLARAAKRTLAKFVLDFIRSNAVIYDGKALFHADHNNLGTAALTTGAFAAARLAMTKQAEAGSNEALGIGPKYLWVPADLEETAADLFRRNTNLDETFVQSLKPTIVPVWYWSDATDWAATASPLDIPTIELGFLDGNEEPELFIQDSPTTGSMFSNDQLTYKIRHIYGATVLDYRGMYKAVVADA